MLKAGVVETVNVRPQIETSDGLLKQVETSCTYTKLEVLPVWLKSWSMHAPVDVITPHS